MSRRTVALSDVTRAVRDVASGDARCALIMPAEEPHHSIHLQGEPGILWAEIQPSQALLRAGWDTEPNEQLLSLGWRPRNKRRYGWYQYFHPTRTRHHRELTRHLKRTFREALDVPGELTVACIDRRVVDPRAPTFETGPTPECTPDHDLLGMAREVLAGFEPDVFSTHLELTVARKHHRVRLAVLANDSTLTCLALHLPDVSTDVATAALATNDRLHRVAYTYAVLGVVGHGRSLVLQSKITLLDRQRILPLVGMLLWTTIEPLVDAHRELHP